VENKGKELILGICIVHILQETTEYFYKIQNNGNSDKEHFDIVLAFDYVLVIIKNDAR
jgi:hypothetical protein